MRTVRVEVKESHISEGVRGNCLRCMLSLAINEAVPGLQAYVGLTGNVYARPGRFPIGTVPDAAREQMHRFDVGLPVRPFAFDFETREAS